MSVFPTSMGPDNFPVTYQQEDEKTHVFTITLNAAKDEAIVIKSFKDMVSVSLKHASADIFESSVGLLGRYDDGSLVARDGITVMEDVNLFGQEWQVQADEPRLFQVPSPFVGKTCLPPAAKTSRRRLGEANVSTEAAELACAHHYDSNVRDMCVFDVIAMADLDVAGVHGTF